MHIAFMADQKMAGRLREARRLYDPELSASEAARRLGIPEPTYLGHENGTRGFRKHVEKYAIFYKVNLAWLLSGVGTPRGKGLEARASALAQDKLAELYRYLEYLERRG